MKSLLSLCLLLTLLPAFTHAFWMSRVFSDNMVLQREPQQAQLWGTTTPMSVVTIVLDSTLKFETYSTQTGEWAYLLPAQGTSVGRTLSVSAADGSATFNNVAFGDVYICSGQSNMEYTLDQVFDADTYINEAGNFPNLRLFTVARNASTIPLKDTATRFLDNSNWVVSSPTYVNGTQWSYFSAVCFLFGADLYQSLGGNVPIGLLETCWGGTRIEAWTSPAGLDVCGPVTSSVEIESVKFIEKPTEHQMKTYSVDADGPDPQTASVLYNGMIYPFLNLRLTGAVWYQAEQNVNNATNYACRFPAMINDWRAQFNNYNLFFGFVLVAAYREGGFPAWPELRDAQLQGLKLPYVGVASAQDLGDENGPQGPIHPRNKSYVGQRLSLFMQNQVYGQMDLYQGPSFTDIIWPVKAAAVQSVILRFDPTSPENQNLHLLDTSGCKYCCSNINGSVITVTLNTGEILRTDVVVDSVAYLVIATADTSAHPESYIAFAQLNWEEYPECSLYNSVKLPHLPFNVSRFN